MNVLRKLVAVILSISMISTTVATTVTFVTDGTIPYVVEIPNDAGLNVVKGIPNAAAFDRDIKLVICDNRSSVTRVKFRSEVWLPISDAQANERDLLVTINSLNDISASYVG